jgi:protein involved in ribonucleotide reduction
MQNPKIKVFTCVWYEGLQCKVNPYKKDGLAGVLGNLLQCSIDTAVSLHRKRAMKPLYDENSGILHSEWNTGHTQKNGAVPKVIKQFISHPTRTQHTLPAAGTVQVSHAYCRAAGPVSKMAPQQEKAFRVLRFEVSGSVVTVQREFRVRF